ncbi:sigma-70 family RNA polymerase sigma factor [uncultured Alistipes sp.]|uniref:sigma-70 family RNA polymerase sigma factor n=1 Tax=uncultured Alistipes sp. TaxID=538949 RepID=UPI00338DD4CA
MRRGGGNSDDAVKAKEQVCEDASRKIEIREEETIMQNRVAEIMSTLTPRQKQAMHYRYIDNLSISEISDVMNMSYQAVLNTIQRALKRIRTNYLN